MKGETRYQPYHIIKRKTRKGKTLFYVRFVDTRTGRTIKEKASGQTSRTAAVRWAEVEYQKMQDSVVEAQTVSAIADGFWDWDASYARGRRARGKSISHGTLDVARSNTENHIIPDGEIRWYRRSPPPRSMNGYSLSTGNESSPPARSPRSSRHYAPSWTAR